MVQIAGFVVAILTVVYQINKQGSLQREKHSAELQLKTYEKIATDIQFVSPVGVATTFQIIFGALKESVRKKEESGIYVPPPFNPESVNKEFLEIHSGLWKVAGTIESYEIVSSNLPLFREALVIKLKQLADTYLPLVRILPYILISEKGINDPEKLLIPTNQDFETLQSKIDDFYEAAYDVAAFLHDIRIEMQNALLGSFFNRKLPIRSPTDNTSLVLTSENEIMLNRVRSFVTENQ